MEEQQPSRSSETQTVGPVKVFFAYVLMAVGLIIASLAGACTVIFSISSPADAFEFILWGVAPILVGIGIFSAGRALGKKNRG